MNNYNNLAAPDNPAGPELIRKEIAAVAQWGREYHRPLWKGEFTAQDGADLNSRSQWMECVRKELEANEILWSVWTLLSDSASYIYDIKSGQWIIPLTQALGLKELIFLPT